MMPMPTPAPMRAIEARPAPMSLAASMSMFRKLLLKDPAPPRSSMMVVQMQGVVQIDAGENGEDIGLEERDQEFQRRDRRDGDERSDGEQRQHAARTRKPDHESTEHEQHRVACQHVREQTDR